MEKKIERNQMTMEKVVKLTNWLNSKRNNPIWATSSRESLAELATKELSYHVTAINLRSVASASGIQLPVARRVGQTVSSKNITRSRLNYLRKAVIDLYKKLGEQVPESLLWE